MRKVSPELLLTISAICENLSAGWFGAALIVPAFSDKPLSLNLSVLTIDLFFGIFFFVIAFGLKRVNKRRRKQWT